MARRVAGDPCWITLRFHGSLCRRCGQILVRGARAFRYKDGSLYCSDEGCGGACSAEFEEAARLEEASFDRG